MEGMSRGSFLVKYLGLMRRGIFWGRGGDNFAQHVCVGECLGNFFVVKCLREFGKNFV